MKERIITNFLNKLETFENDTRNDQYGRYRSWEHCYYIFNRARNNNARNNETYIDYLSLHLAFYLASWGMYRGSSFLLQRDYKVHIGAVKEILKDKYNYLFGIKWSELGELEKSNQLDMLMELKTKLNAHYIRFKFPSEDNQNKNEKVSDTLITKILMGTMGCVPAYDRYFVSGIKNSELKNRSFTRNSVKELIDFYNDNGHELENKRILMKIEEGNTELEYPQMKMLDMGFWQIGYDLDSKQNKL